jgi:predicted DNA-binding transcriptional regulator YafY
MRNLVLESGKIQDRIILEDVPSTQNFLEDIVLAMQGNRVIHVSYNPYTSDQPFTLDLEPYFLKLFNKRWYMFCHRSDSDIIKVYALDRVKSLVLSERTFNMPLDFSPEVHLFNSIGIIKRGDTPPVEIIIKAYGLHPNYLKALPMHHTQKELKSTSDFTLFSYQLSPTSDFYEELLSRKEYVEIVSPAEVREKFKTILSRIVDYYNGNESH